MQDAALKDKDAAVSANAEDGPSMIFGEWNFPSEKTGDIIVKVYDAETNEIVRKFLREDKGSVANILERAGF